MIPHYIIISVIIQSPQSRRFHRLTVYIKCPEKQRGQSGEAGRNYYLRHMAKKCQEG